MPGKSDYTALAARTQGYALQVKRLYDEAVKELLDIAKQVKSLEQGDMFTFDKYDSMKDKAERALRKLHAAVYTAVKRGIELEWGRADKAADEFVASVFGRVALKDKRYSTMLLRHESAMEAFIKRTDKGMNLSDKVWQPVEQLRKEMELAITVSIGEGESASTISRRVRQYLNEPDRLFRRVRDEKGNLKLSKAAAAYHPGRGVYRSSYKNAMRLARTETNMAYRNEDCNRVGDLDFILGIRIQTSKNHPEDDICDELAGDYPKTFKWTGWHPQCRCYMTTILPNAEELRKYNKALLNGENYPLSGKVKDAPAAFKAWVNDHSEKIENSPSVPYFVSDNQKLVDNILGKKPSIEEIAAARHAARTPEQEQAIRDAWAERNHRSEVIKKGANNVLNVAQGWAEVDATALQDAINSGDYMKMKEAAKEVSQAIVEMRNRENALKDIIPDVHTQHQQFSITELEQAHSAISSKLAQITALPLDKQVKALEKELLYIADPNYLKPHKVYPTWKIAQSAYMAKADEVEETILWNGYQNTYNTKAAFVTKSQPYKDLLLELQDAIAKKDKAAADSAIIKIEQKRAELDKKAAQRAKKNANVTEIDYATLSDAEKNSLLAEYKTNDEDDVDKALTPEAIAQFQNVTQDERDRLRKYTLTYSYLNEPLRNITYMGARPSQEYIDDLPIMTSALQKCVTSMPLVVRRGTGDYYIPEIGKNLSDVEVGDVFIDGGFLSSAVHRDRGFSRSYNMVIIVPKGAQGIYAKNFSHYPSEYEWIGQRGSRFRVISKSGNTIYVEMIGQLYTQPK